MRRNFTITYLLNAFHPLKRQTNKSETRKYPSQESVDLIMQYAKSYNNYKLESIGNIEIMGN